MSRQFKYQRLLCHLSGLALACTLLLVGKAYGQQGVNDLELTQQFLHEAPSAWANYCEQVDRLQGELFFKVTGTYKNVKAENHHTVKANKRCKLVAVSRERTIEGKRDYQVASVFAVNPKYAFLVARQKPDSPWTAAELLVGRNSEANARYEQSLGEIRRAFRILVSLEDGQYLLRDLVDSPEFRVTNSRWVAEKEEKLAEIVFEYPHKLSERGNPIQAGTLVVDPERFWCLRSFKVVRKYLGGHGKAAGSFEAKQLKIGDKSLPVPKDVFSRYDTTFDEGFQSTREITLHYDLGIPERLPDDEEFTLSAFGLPEPPGPGKQGPALYVWAAVLGFGSLALAMVFYWRGRREQTSRQT